MFVSTGLSIYYLMMIRPATVLLYQELFNMQLMQLIQTLVLVLSCMNLHFPVHEVDDRNIGLEFLTGTIFWTGPLTFISPVGASGSPCSRGEGFFTSLYWYTYM